MRLKMPWNRFWGTGTAPQERRPTERKEAAIPSFHHSGVQDRILRVPGKAELPLCPEFLGGAAAPALPERLPAARAVQGALHFQLRST